MPDSFDISSWTDVDGQSLFEGARVQYESDLLNTLAHPDIRPVKLYGKIVKSKWNWYGVLPDGFPSDERPLQLWSISKIKII
jgi:hypothetical protein